MDNTFNIPAGSLTLGQRNRLDDEAHSLARLLRDPVPGSDFNRVIDACNGLRYALLAVDAVPGEPVARIERLAKSIHEMASGIVDYKTRRDIAEAALAIMVDAKHNVAASVASRAGSEPVGIVKHLEKIDVVWITHPSSMAENTHLYAVAPAAAAELSEHLTIALDMLDYLSGYPDFTAPEGELISTAIADAIAGKMPKLLSDIGFLSQGLRPPAPDRAGVASLVARMTRLKDAIEGECNGLAITDDVAKEIIAYIDTGLPPYLRSATQAKP